MTTRAEELAHTVRNSAPILEVLKREYGGSARVLEIGSGNGQHAVVLTSQLPHLSWQTSDLAVNHERIRYWISEATSDNVLPPLELDVSDHDIGEQRYDAMFSANTAHIMSISAVESMFHLAGEVLLADGVFCLYGPFRQNGQFNTDSNAAFNRSLQSQDPHMGIRDIEMLDTFGEASRLVRRRLYAMPANNHLAVWQKLGG